MEIIGYLGGLLIGVTLGFLGGGGSILAVPIFVYLLGIAPVTATGYSLFVVGSTASIGAVRNYTKGLLDIKTGIAFGAPSLVAVYLTRKYLIPAIPDELFTVGSFTLSKDMGIMVLFATVMLAAALSMIFKKSKEGDSGTKIHYNYPLILIEGVVVGVLTGIVGAGGGFIIIPALVLLSGLPMKRAVGTSLFIVSLKSLIGFIGDIQNIEIDWMFLLSFTGLSVIGILIGIYLAQFVSNKALKKAFGWFVLLMAFYILYKEIA